MPENKHTKRPELAGRAGQNFKFGEKRAGNHSFICTGKKKLYFRTPLKEIPFPFYGFSRFIGNTQIPKVRSHYSANDNLLAQKSILCKHNGIFAPKSCTFKFFVVLLRAKLYYCAAQTRTYLQTIRETNRPE